jgi:serine/threonine protein kinase/Tol biopolymer transport system component
MPVAAGSRLGPYEVVARLGAGGMGEVWRGRDTRLDRSVAIKVLPAEFAADAQFKIRFEREAKTISQLNHPNICTLYDVGDGYLVMELLERESLAEKLTKGPLPLEQVLRYGVQIAEALDKAHRAGIVHRDLKPGNVMLTKSGAKLLDFGLAKSARIFDADGATQHKALTQEGMILGTFQYMAPEQLEGLEADARTDIFAFGTLLYEMATGKRAFEGKTKTSLIAAIVSAEPAPMSQIVPLTPPALEHVVRKCLGKDRDDRWQSAHDIAQELRWISDMPDVASTSKKKGGGLLLTATAILATIAGLGIARFVNRPGNGLVVRFTIPTSDGPYHDARLTAPSPDGKRLIIPAVNREGIGQLFIRNIDSLDVQPLAGTERTETQPLFGTSSKWLLFASGTRLKKLDLDARTIETISDYVGYGSSINDEGNVLYVAGNVIVMKARDGAARAVTQLDRAAREQTHRWPTFLPDGKHFLYVARADADAPRPGVLYLASIDSPKRIAVTDSLFRSVYSSGYLFLPRETKLMAFPFDAKRGAITGEGVVMAEKINTFTDEGWAAFNVTGAGVLTYRIRTDEAKLVWMDQNGHVSGSIGGVAGFSTPRISPDGKRVALAVEDPETQTDDIWIYGIDRPTSERVTNGKGNKETPVWSPDGKRLAYLSMTSISSGTVHIRSLDSGSDETIATGPFVSVVAWSADGKKLFCNTQPSGKPGDISAIDVGGTLAQTSLIPASFGKSNGRPSKDGLLVFDSDVSGKNQVYVQQNGGEKVQVSVDGGENARWSADGRRVYFATNTGKMMVADVTRKDHAIVVSEPRQLFQFSFSFTFGDYDVGPDGRFLVTAPVERSEWAPSAVIVNWQQALKEHP